MADADVSVLLNETQRLLDEISQGPTKNGFADPFSASLITDMPDITHRRIPLGAFARWVAYHSQTPNHRTVALLSLQVRCCRSRCCRSCG